MSLFIFRGNGEARRQSFQNTDWNAGPKPSAEVLLARQEAMGADEPSLVIPNGLSTNYISHVIMGRLSILPIDSPNQDLHSPGLNTGDCTQGRAGLSTSSPGTVHRRFVPHLRDGIQWTNHSSAHCRDRQKKSQKQVQVQAQRVEIMGYCVCSRVPTATGLRFESPPG